MLKPLGDRVVIRVAKEEEKTVGGIVLASVAKEKPQTGEVIAVGEGRVLENGTKVPMEVKIGDTVMFEKYSGTEVKYEGVEYLIVSAKTLLPLLNNKQLLQNNIIEEKNYEVKKSWQKRLNLQKMHVQQCYAE